MRFLLDEGLSPRVAALLRAAGHDAVHARHVGLTSAADPIVLQVRGRLFVGKPAGTADGRHFVSYPTQDLETLRTNRDAQHILKQAL